jgi:hypothetical protein
VAVPGELTFENKFHQIAVLNLRKGRYNLRKEHLSLSKVTMATACKHPRVRIVSRHEDTEYVECLECGDVFDSEEFQDMAIEESTEKEEELDDE